jgi:hypothetical protein
MSPQEVVQEHRDELAGSKPFGSAASNASANKNETVDGQWTVVDKDL